MNSISLRLFNTSGCHLCELAVLEVKEFNDVMLQHNIQITLEETDVSTSETLFAQYGERIPVLFHDETLFELSWPFNAESIYDFVRKL